MRCREGHQTYLISTGAVGWRWASGGSTLGESPGQVEESAWSQEGVRAACAKTGGERCRATKDKDLPNRLPLSL